MNRAHKLGCWAVLVAGCSFNQVKDPVEIEPTTPPVLGGEAVSAKVAPAPVSGGTLLVARKAPLAFASNPDGNVVDVVDLDKKIVVWQADLGDGAEPGRLVEDAAGKVHVVLRRAGAIATLDPVARTIVKQEVCAAPRGIAIQDGVILVACEGGQLVSISPGGIASASIDRDLRDVLPRPDGSMFVTRFRSAEVLTVDARGSVVGRSAPLPMISRKNFKRWQETLSDMA